MHLMIDLETLGREEDAVILEVGLCLFDSEIYDSLQINVNVDAYDLSRHSVDMGTIRWWMERGGHSLKGDVRPDAIPHTILGWLGKWNVNIGDLNLWAKSITFDVSKLRYHFLQYCYDGWVFNFRRIHEVRTLCFYHSEPYDWSSNLEKHVAVNDAIIQAQYVQWVLGRAL